MATESEVIELVKTLRGNGEGDYSIYFLRGPPPEREFLYVGLTKSPNQRRADHFRKGEDHYNLGLADAFFQARENGQDLEWEVICSSLSAEDAVRLERALVDFIGHGERGPLQNRVRGGNSLGGQTMLAAARPGWGRHPSQHQGLP